MKVATPTGEIAVHEAGSGAPIVLLHGGPGLDRTCFAPLIGALQARARILSWDLARSSARSVAAWASEVLAVLDALEIDRADVLGHSHGAAIAMAFAAGHPSRVRGLVLASPPALGARAPVGLPTLLARGTRAQIDAYLGPRAGDQAALEARWQLLLPLYFREPSTLREREVISAHVQALANAGIDFEAFELGLASFQSDPPVDTAALTMPTLLCGGAHDWISPPAVLEAWRDLLPRANTRTFAASAHFPFMEEPVAFADAVVQFCTGAGAASPQQRKPSS